MAQAAGLTHAAIARTWRALELTPHVPGTFNRSCDPFFVGNVRDIGGLDLNPPELHRIVLAQVAEFCGGDLGGFDETTFDRLSLEILSSMNR